MGILQYVLLCISPFPFSPDFSSKISPHSFKRETSNLVYRLTTTSYKVGLKMDNLLFVLLSFSLHFSSKIPAICFGSAKAGV